MIEKVAVFLTLGAKIGLGAGLLRVMQCIQKGNFKWSRALMHIASAGVVGYFIYEVGTQAGLSGAVVYSATFILSINSFVTIELLTDKKTVEGLINKFLKK